MLLVWLNSRYNSAICQRDTISQEDGLRREPCHSESEIRWKLICLLNRPCHTLKMCVLFLIEIVSYRIYTNQIDVSLVTHQLHYSVEKLLKELSILHKVCQIQHTFSIHIFLKKRFIEFKSALGYNFHKF